ncbi:hypothetical protein M1N61_01760 [Peptococcaceae bacterium]|nr:hypothetical protein [Peptococcaceae bacterium]
MIKTKNVSKQKTKRAYPQILLQSTHDEDATYRTKGGKGQSGYLLNLSETCSKDNPFQLITDYRVDQNIKSDVELIKDRLPVIKENTGCKELYADGGFYSDEVVKLGKDNGINLLFTNLSGREPSKKLPVTEYQIDESTNIITKCPKGITPLHTSITKDQTLAHFPLKACENCEYRKKCHCKKQKKSYVVRISIKSIRSAQQRKKAYAQPQRKH